MPALERLLIVPDTHAPYHDEKAWKLVMKVGRSFKPEILIHQGDLADCYSLSFHSKDPSRIFNWKQEREVCRKLRREMDKLEPKRKIFTEGNHCHRLHRYLCEKAPALHGLITMDDELQTSANDWQFVPYKDHIRVGKVYFTHDAGGGGKYPTSTAMDTYQHSVSIAHHHRLQMFVKGDATGQHRVGASFGWLGDPRTVEYMHKIKVLRDWTPGFGIGYLNRKNGHVFLTPVPIVKNSCVVEGKLFAV